MDFRARRQLAVLAIVALVLFGVGFLLYRSLTPAPTCQDNRKNQGEEEMDCGGPCIPCAFRHQQPLGIFWTRFTETREGTYDVAAEIRNPNEKLGAASFVYEFKIYDTAGVLVASQRGTSFIYPSETVHLVEVGLRSGRTIQSVALAIQDERWVLTGAIAPDVIAGNREYTVVGEGSERRSTVSALITNRTLIDLKGVLVSVLVLDDGGNLLGVHRTVLDTLRTGETKPATFLWPLVFPRPASSMFIEARSDAALPRAGQ